MTTISPKNLSPGVYWYVALDKEPSICEKKAGEDFVRFTNGAQQSWAREGEAFAGPLPAPIFQPRQERHSSAAEVDNGLLQGVMKARDALADLNQREDDDGELLDELDSLIAKARSAENQAMPVGAADPTQQIPQQMLDRDSSRQRLHQINAAGLVDSSAREIFAAYLDAVQPAEERCGPEGQDYVALMRAIASEATQRAENALAIQSEDSPLP